MKNKYRWTLLTLVAVVGTGACSASNDAEDLIVPAGYLGGQVWADKWFAMYVGETLGRLRQVDLDLRSRDG